ncbi:g7968 [Coccomyxa elongata]
MDSKQITSLVRIHGRRGLLSRVLQLDLEKADKPAESYPVLPRLVHINATTDEVENITLMHCPPERIVTIAVPIKVVGEELSPGVKKGGHLNLIQRTVKCMGAASSIPESIEIDVSSLDFGQRIYPSGISIPPGVSPVGLVAGQPLCKLAGRASRD